MHRGKANESTKRTELYLVRARRAYGMPDSIRKHAERLRANLSRDGVFFNVKRQLRPTKGDREEKTTRTERGVIVTSDIALRAGYHYRLVHPVNEAVDVHALEGITVLRGERQD
jgi:hypothetical protein